MDVTTRMWVQNTFCWIEYAKYTILQGNSWEGRVPAMKLQQAVMLIQLLEARLYCEQAGICLPVPFPGPRLHKVYLHLRDLHPGHPLDGAQRLRSTALQCPGHRLDGVNLRLSVLPLATCSLDGTNDLHMSDLYHGSFDSSLFPPVQESECTGTK